MDSLVGDKNGWEPWDGNAIEDQTVICLFYKKPKRAFRELVVPRLLPVPSVGQGFSVYLEPDDDEPEDFVVEEISWALSRGDAVQLWIHAVQNDEA